MATVRWRLDDQDGCHYEPLILRATTGAAMTTTRTAATAARQENNHAGALRADSEREANRSTDITMNIMMANISTYSQHHQQALETMKSHDAKVAILSETQIRDNAKQARITAAMNGYAALLSDPRPLKQGAHPGPHEGGIAILIRQGLHAPDLGRARRETALHPDHAIHTAVPIRDGHGLHLHVIGAYTQCTDEGVRNAIIEYAESLGDVPTIIAADWNTTVDTSNAVRQALLTGKWIGPVQQLVESGDARATQLLQQGTTHLGDTVGSRVDFFLLNQAAAPFVQKVDLLLEDPFVNHYAITVTLRLPLREPIVYEATPTKRYPTDAADAATAVRMRDAWARYSDHMAAEWSDYTTYGNVQAMWDQWNRIAQAACDDVTGAKITRRPKGTLPALRPRNLWAADKHSGAESIHARRLWKAYQHLLRIRILTDHVDAWGARLVEEALRLT